MHFVKGHLIFSVEIGAGRKDCSPDSNQQKNREKSNQREHDVKKHDPLVYPAMGDQGRFGVGPAHSRNGREMRSKITQTEKKNPNQHQRLQS